MDVEYLSPIVKLILYPQSRHSIAMWELQQLQSQSRESIEQKTRQARQKLQDLINHLKKSDQIGGSCAYGLSPLAITDILEKFVLWAGNLGALQGPTTRLSLDYRLSENPEVRDEIITQLEDICEATDDRKYRVDLGSAAS